MTHLHSFVRLSLLALGALALVACGPFRLRPASPMRATAVSAVNVSYAPELPEDRVNMLERVGVPDAMEEALMGSFPNAPGVTLNVVITEFRSGRYDVTRMHVFAQLVDAAGNVTQTLEADSTSAFGGSRTDLIGNVSQDIVNQLAAQL